MDIHRHLRSPRHQPEQPPNTSSAPAAAASQSRTTSEHKQTQLQAAAGEAVRTRHAAAARASQHAHFATLQGIAATTAVGKTIPRKNSIVKHHSCYNKGSRRSHSHQRRAHPSRSHLSSPLFRTNPTHNAPLTASMPDEAQAAGESKAQYFRWPSVVPS